MTYDGSFVTNLHQNPYTLHEYNNLPLLTCHKLKYFYDIMIYVFTKHNILLA